ncbi:MAG: type II secretion system F family protein [Clostridia bacterium]|nr:type II secretion system F family protein [Clostridia bacterium]
MPAYNYRAITKTGKTIKGSIEASSADAGKASLRNAGYAILDFAPQTTLNKEIQIPFLGNPRAKHLAVFCRQFVSILKAGVQVSEVLSMLAQQTDNKKLRDAIRSMQADVEKGQTLASSMAKFPRIFNSMLVNMVAAGEESGNLESSFKQMEVYFDRAQKTKNSALRVMMYPIVLIVVMIIVLFVMMTRIIPSFLKNFEAMGAELPALTKGVMAVSNFFAHWWWLLVLILLGLVFGGILYGKTNQGKHFFGAISRKLPFSRSFIPKRESAVFCRTLSLLLGSGLTLTSALQLCASNMTNIYYKEAVENVRTMVQEGWPLTTALNQTGLFPAMVTNLAGIGEETGDLQDMLAKTADYYDEEVEAATQRMLALLEPMVILFMAGFVAIIVFSIFLPMLNMTKLYDQYLQ